MEAVLWRGNNYNEVIELVRENVYDHPIPKDSLMLKDAVGTYICPIGHYIVKIYDFITVMDPKYFQRVYKEIE